MFRRPLPTAARHSYVTDLPDLPDVTAYVPDLPDVAAYVPDLSHITDATSPSHSAYHAHTFTPHHHKSRISLSAAFPDPTPDPVPTAGRRTGLSRVRTTTGRLPMAMEPTVLQLLPGGQSGSHTDAAALPDRRTDPDPHVAAD